MSTRKDMDALLQGFVDAGLPGCGLKVVQRDKVVYEGYFGMADAEAGKPVTEDSIFRHASTSKLPLYTAAMMLYERGKFLLTDPLYEFLPEYRTSHKVVRNPNGSVDIVETDRPINIKDVLTMSCGLPYVNFPVETDDVTLRAMVKAMQPLWEKGHYTNREHVKAMANVPLAFEPGSRWLYGFASELTCALVEAVTGKSVDDAMQEMLFDPLEMNSTRSHFFGDTQERMVKLYTRDPEGNLKPFVFPLEKTFLPGPENEMGWARLFSTVGDFSNLMQMLANGGEYKGRRIMGRKTIDLMRTNTLNADQMKDFLDPYEEGYGYGFGVRTLIDPNFGNHNGSLGSFGWTGGYGTWVESDPAEGVSIVYMHNMMPNGERYYHPRVRTVAYGLIR
ncbi:MAG: serine hydrolase [Firmicutes bacterium]|nr:serine hydrolase [Bacillota bacterium]